MSHLQSNKKHGIIQEPKELRPLGECNTNRNGTTPTELLMQFLTCVMTKDYEQALVHCTEILKKEPDNSTALEFYPLILEKMEMMKCEEEDSSSESSSNLSSSSSSSSENTLFSECIRRDSIQGKKENNLSSEQAVVADKINMATSAPLAKEIVDESIKIQNSSMSLQTRQKKIVETLPNEFKTKMAEGKTSLSSLLLIHPTKTVTIIGNNAKHKRTTKHTNSKKEQTSAISKQPSSKILLHTSRTITFPKKHNLRNLPMIGNLK